MAETVLMGGPLDIGMLSLPDATLGRCEDCTRRIVYKGWAPAEIATVCVACAASRLKANPELIVLAPSGERRMVRL